MSKPTDSVELPDIPSQPVDLEDCAAALFQAAGYFVERNIIEKEEGEIQELDVVATSYDAPSPSTIVVEAKSGKWGHRDIFTIYGRMKYLGVSSGALVVAKPLPERETDRIRRWAEQLGIAVVCLDSADLSSKFVGIGLPIIRSTAVLDVWRFSYTIERAMIRYLRHRVSSERHLQGAKAALRYHTLINNELFFERDARLRLFRLYEAFSQHPKLALGVAVEMEKGTFDPDASDPKNKMIRDAMYHGHHDLLQVCFYLEHRARLAILKTAIDLHCAGPTPPKPILRHKGKAVLTQDDFLPVKFRQGLKKLQEQPYFRQYACFWQAFLWGFGGFYLRDRKDLEFQWLSEHSGVPVDEIPNALDALDALFPTGTSWLTDAYNSQCRVVKMVPMPLQGMGAYHRQMRHGVKEYADLGYSDMTGRDLAKWHNKGYEVLRNRQRYG